VVVAFASSNSSSSRLVTILERIALLSVTVALFRLFIILRINVYLCHSKRSESRGWINDQKNCCCCCSVILTRTFVSELRRCWAHIFLERCKINNITVVCCSVAVHVNVNWIDSRKAIGLFIPYFFYRQHYACVACFYDIYNVCFV
jgi:hypothetical protein